MKNLLYKEWKLSMTPQSWIFLIMVGMVFIPDYPIIIPGVFALSAIPQMIAFSKEANDILFTATLPIKRNEVPKSKILFVISYELLFLLLIIICLIPAGYLYSHFSTATDVEGNFLYGNNAGMDANIAVVGIYLLTFAVNNFIFFPWYYKHPDKFTVPFFVSFIIASLFGCAIYFALGFMPFTKDIFDALTIDNWYYQLIFTVCSGLIFVGLSFLTIRLSVKHFAKVDI